MASVGSRFRQAALALAAVSVASLVAPTSAGAAQQATNGRIAYTLEGSIYTSLPDGSDVQRLTTGPEDSDLAWSPNGRALAFRTDPFGFGWSIIQADGGQRAVFFSDACCNVALAFQWSPDGLKMLYGPGNANPTDLFVVNEDGDVDDAINLTDGEDGASADLVRWSPNSDGLAYELRGNIYYLPLDGSGPRALTTTGNNEYNPVWSPNGDIIVYQRDRWTPQCSGGGPTLVTELWAIRVASGIPYRLHLNPCGEDLLGTVPFGLQMGSSWSPNGHDLVFSTIENPATQDYWPMIVDARDGSIVNYAVAGSGYFPSWSPDGQYIFYDNGGGLVRNTPLGDDPVPLPTDDFPDPILDWSPTGTHFVSGWFNSFTGNWRLNVAESDGTNHVLVPLPTPSTSAMNLPVSWSPDGQLLVFVDGAGTHTFDVDSHELRQLSLPEGAVFGGWQPIVSADTTPPSVVGTPGRPANSNGWYKANVIINWSASDPAPSSGTPSDPPNTVAATEGANVVYTSAPSCDPAGNCATGSRSLSIDKTAPILAPIVSPAEVLLGGTVSISPNATDPLSGEATQSCGAGNTSTVGNKSVTCTATDRAGNARTAAKSYAVHYRWDGFLQPINDLVFNPTMRESRFRLGSTVQVMFKLKRSNGTAVQASVAPTFSRSANLGACDAVTTLEAVNNTTGTTGTAYRWTASTSTYFFNWRTTGVTAGEYRITATLNDGTQRWVDICLRT